MSKRIGGSRHKSRHKTKKGLRQKGKLSIRRFLQKFSEGDKVALSNESSYRGGVYHMRHHGRIGTVIGTKGKCYKVQIRDINKLKMLVVHPVHLKRL
jgi:large subunit ribosomal protein L21e